MKFINPMFLPNSFQLIALHSLPLQLPLPNKIDLSTGLGDSWRQYPNQHKLLKYEANP